MLADSKGGCIAMSGRKPGAPAASSLPDSRARARDGFCLATRRTIWPIGASLAIAAWPGAAFAQITTTLIRPSIPEGFDRGRNVSVLEAPRPDYDPLPIPVGSFNLYPRIEVGAGATDNVYLSRTNQKSDGFAYVDPSVTAQSDWSRHQLQFVGSADLVRFFNQTLRNQNSFNLDASGRVDIGESFTVHAEAQGQRQFETPFSGDVQSNVAVLSSYLQDYYSLRGEYQAGQGRAMIAYDRTGLDFSSIELNDGSTTSQRYRNRHVDRVSGQIEYAFTPSVSIYGQASYDKTSYDAALSAIVPKRDSRGSRIIGGVNVDIAGFMRGTVGIGYIHRNYLSPSYNDVSGVSAEGKLEFFPSELTTFTLAARRVVQDSSIGSTNAYFDNRVSARVDHQLLRNLLLNAIFEYGKIDYIGTKQETDTYRASAGGRYYASHHLGLTGTVSYGKQTPNDLAFGQMFHEVRGQLGIFYQP